MQTDPEDFTFKNIMVDEISSNNEDEIFGQDDPFKLAVNFDMNRRGTVIHHSATNSLTTLTSDVKGRKSFTQSNKTTPKSGSKPYGRMPAKFSGTPTGGFPNSMFKESPQTPSEGKDKAKTS